MVVEGGAGYSRQAKRDEVEGWRSGKDEETEQPVLMSDEERQGKIC